MNDFYHLEIDITKKIDRYLIEYTKKNLNIIIDEIKIYITEKGFKRLLVINPEHKMMKNKNNKNELNCIFTDKYEHIKSDHELRNTYNIWDSIFHSKSQMKQTAIGSKKANSYKKKEKENISTFNVKENQCINTSTLKKQFENLNIHTESKSSDTNLFNTREDKENILNQENFKKSFHESIMKTLRTQNSNTRYDHEKIDEQIEENEFNNFEKEFKHTFEILPYNRIFPYHNKQNHNESSSE